MGDLDDGLVHVSLETGVPATPAPSVPGFLGDVGIVDHNDRTRGAQVSAAGEVLVNARKFDEMLDELRRIRKQLETMTEERIP